MFFLHSLFEKRSQGTVFRILAVFLRSLWVFYYYYYIYIYFICGRAWLKYLSISKICFFSLIKIIFLLLLFLFYPSNSFKLYVECKSVCIYVNEFIFEIYTLFRFKFYVDFHVVWLAQKQTKKKRKFNN